jgi:hypothetical protein
MIYPSTPSQIAHLIEENEKYPNLLPNWMEIIDKAKENDKSFSIFSHPIPDNPLDDTQDEFEDGSFQDSFYSLPRDLAAEWINYSKNAAWAYFYAYDVIEGRFPEGEEAISRDAVYAYLYARDIIKGRWPEGEEVISKDAYWAREYKRLVSK